MGSWTGWSEVPGNRLTLGGPGATVFNNELYLFVEGKNDLVQGINNRIYLNRFNGVSWSGWSEVPGGGLTPSEPEAVVFKNALYLFVRGTNSRIYLNRFNGVSWSGWSEVPGGGLTLSGPGAAVFQNALYLAVQGTDNRIYDNLLVVSNWTGWMEVLGGGLIPSGPAAVAFNNQLRYFVRGTGTPNNRIYQNRLSPGPEDDWSGWSEVAGNGLTPSGPGATATASTLYLVVRGNDNGIYLLNQTP